MQTERRKYQFAIIVNNSSTHKSAAIKAVLDCRDIFNGQGYQDYNLYFTGKKYSLKYYFLVFAYILKFFLCLKKGAVVGVQYPLLNNVFKYFIIAAKLKNVKFFCIVHDIESLRAGAQDELLATKEAANLNYYNEIIVHNQCMMQWLKDKGVTTKMLPLMLFDYISTCNIKSNLASLFSKTIVFAGNLSKSNFIYLLDKINWNFNLYGPNYNQQKTKLKNVKWIGEFKPNNIVHELKGDFGLIWDGESIDECDQILGNYLKYNNPHKFSLYLAAGLPVIAPKFAAIAPMIARFNIGILINSLTDINFISITNDEYNLMKKKCLEIREDVINGNFFMTALRTIEHEFT